MRIKRGQIDSINSDKFEKIDALVDTILNERLTPQTIPPGRLDVPPYARQDDGLHSPLAVKLSANACFRMVFGGIAGWVPNEEVLAQSFANHRGDILVEDNEYHKLFMTHAFTRMCWRQVSVLDIVGTDLATIDARAQKIRERLPNARIYCVVSLAPVPEYRNVWHSNVLLGATGTDVTRHNPSTNDGQANASMPKDTFIRQWATALNRAQLYIATPLKNIATSSS